MIDERFGQRGTDEVFLKLMTLSGDALLKLLGMDAQIASTYQFRATVLKQKRLFPDVEGWSLVSGEHPRILLEFQGYADPFVRYRTAAKVFMTCMQENYPGPVLAGIIYTDAPFRNAALPLTPMVRGQGCRFEECFVEVVLSDFSEERLKEIDPRLLIMAPLTMHPHIEPEQLQHKGYVWRQAIKENFPDDRYQAALEILGLFAVERFHALKVEEIIQMLNFDPNLPRATERAFKEGGSSLFLFLLEDKFGKLPEALREKVFFADRSSVERWGHRLLRTDSLEEVFGE
ncbi:MAG: DUF2887 domain-containing protein [Magnetococcales bacterium]|nr:DUF2887 domain-containing protein [Magnetococcales bacterium]